MQNVQWVIRNGGINHRGPGERKLQANLVLVFLVRWPLPHVLQSWPIIPRDKWWAISWGWSILIRQSEHGAHWHTPGQHRCNQEKEETARDQVWLCAVVSTALSSGVLCPGCNKVNTGSERTNNFLLLTHKDCQLSTTGPPPLSL